MPTPDHTPSAAQGRPVPVESLLDEDDFAVIREEQTSDVPVEDMPGTRSAATRYVYDNAVRRLLRRLTGRV